MKARKDFAKELYKAHLRSMKWTKQDETNRDILVMEGLGCIKKGEYKAGKRGALIKIK